MTVLVWMRKRCACGKRLLLLRKGNIIWQHCTACD